jgi:hypothetical protein
MNSKVIRKQINYLALARNRPRQLMTPSFEEGARRKAREIRAHIQQLRKSALGRHGPAMARLAQEADALENELSRALTGTTDA